MSSRFFNVKNPSQVVTIVEDKDKFYELSDGSMIKKDSFMSKYQPVLEDIPSSNQRQVVNENRQVQQPQESMATDHIDPNSFFNSPSISNDILNKIKTVDPSRVPNVNDNMRSEVKRNTTDQVTKRPQHPTMNESLVKPVENPIIPNNTNTDVSQYKVYDDDDEAYQDFVNKSKGEQPQLEPEQKPQLSDIEIKKKEIESLFDDEKLALGEEEAIKRRTKRLEKLPKETLNPVENTSTESTSSQYQQPQLNPVEMMFSTFKRNHDIKINVEFNDKIANPDFIKLMIENMDGDIVGFYKKKVMDNIMKDLSKIENIVEETIRKEIFGEDKKKEEKPLPKEVKLIDGLIPGGTTKSGKQKYLYVDDKSKVKEVTPETAKKNNYEPYTDEK